MKNCMEKKGIGCYTIIKWKFPKRFKLTLAARPSKGKTEPSVRRAKRTYTDLRSKKNARNREKIPSPVNCQRKGGKRGNPMHQDSDKFGGGKKKHVFLGLRFTEVTGGVAVIKRVQGGENGLSTSILKPEV